LIACFAAVHDNEATAREMFDKYIRGYSRSALEHYEFHNEGLAHIKGYEYYGKLAQNIKRHGVDAFVDFLAELQIWGTPDQVFEKMRHYHEIADTAGCMVSFSFGGMPYDMARANQRLFAEKVLPRLKAIPVHEEIGAGRPLDIAAGRSGPAAPNPGPNAPVPIGFPPRARQ
jgi:alkanesulfonate monooxygenase SsuD/methylene tetrahydromethanopterin reductase-like flavin-dependent oxidoreductase (luciferase family)